MSVIGQQIKKYRMAKSITQEQLGQLVGVTTQAVSKWECGGTPDAELLPSLADALGVSIDALFGREEKNAVLSLVHKLRDMPDKESFDYAFCTCWAIIHGLMHDPIPDSVLNAYMDLDALNSVPHPRFARIMHDSGMTTARISPDFLHFFLMVEPKEGLTAHLSEPAKLREVFSLFSNEETLKVLTSMYTRLNTPVAASLISKISGMAISEVESHLELLCRNDLVKRTVIATADGETYSYMFNHESAVIAMLCFADELAQQEEGEFAWSMIRTRPMLQSTIG